MNLFLIDDVIKDPIKYVNDILYNPFCDIQDGDSVFKNIQLRGSDDEFAQFVLSYFNGYSIAFNIVRKSELNQEEPNYIHKDDMMGDITCLLYLSRIHPSEDGTKFYDDKENLSCRVYSKFNRMVAFSSDASHSRSIYENFGNGEYSRLVQAIFLKKL